MFMLRVCLMLVKIIVTANWDFIKYNILNNLLGMSKKTKRKSYEKEYKLQAVHLVQSDKRVAEVARELTLHNKHTKLGKKISNDAESSFVESDILRPEDKEDKELQK